MGVKGFAITAAPFLFLADGGAVKIDFDIRENYKAYYEKEGDYMKPIIIRKPKFMRSDRAMKTYIEVAENISKEACRPELTPEESYELLKIVGECLNEAAKAGGFRNVGDMEKWMKSQITI